MITEADAEGFEASLEAGAQAWLLRIVDRIAELRRAGMNNGAIRERLLADEALGRPDSFTRQIQDRYRILQQVRYQQANLGHLLQDTAIAEQPFMWNAVGRKTCPNCTARHGEVATLAEWQERGLPGRGATVCRWRCRCTLLPQAKAMKLYRVRDPQQLTAAAREPIVARTAEVESRFPDQAPSTKAGKIGDFRQPDAPRTLDPRSVPVNREIARIAKIVDARFRRLGRNPRSMSEVGNSEYARMIHAVRRDELRSGGRLSESAPWIEGEAPNPTRT